MRLIFGAANSRRRRMTALAFLFGFTVMGCNSQTPATIKSANSGPAVFDRAFLEPLISTLPTSMQQAILADIAGFKANLETVIAGDSDLLVLVDKHLALPESYVPPDLVSIDGLKPALAVSKTGQKIRRLAVPALQALFQASRKANVSLVVSSAYRSYQYQVGTFEREVKNSSRAEAERVVALPGHSQHQLGLAIDFNSISDDFAATRAGKWLFAHAAEYGFSLSYPEGKEAETGYTWECWHYRYIGIAACQLQKTFFDDSQQQMLVFLDRHGAALRAQLAAAADAAKK